MNRIAVRNLHRTRRVHSARLRRFTQHLLELLLPGQTCSIAIHLVGHRTITRLNQKFLHHVGSTDIITFDYTGEPGIHGLAGELFISMDDAVAQARSFGTTWTAELARYVVHGLLHLAGHDDHDPTARRRMKTAEDRLLRRLARNHPLHLLAARSSSPIGSTRLQPNPASRKGSTTRPQVPSLPGGEGRGEGGPHSRIKAAGRRRKPAPHKGSTTRPTSPPLPGGEGRGEGGPFFRLESRTRPAP